MIKKYHIPATLLFLLCTSTLLFAQKSIYTFPFENSYRLAPMATQINMEEIAGTYQTVGNLYTTEITGLGDETMEQTSTTMVSDVRAMDALRLLEFYMEEQLVLTGEQTSGTVELSVIYYNTRSRANLGTAIDILTLGIGVFLGIPFATGVTDVEVEATFFDDDKRILTTHRGIGQSKVLESLYNMDYSKRNQHQKAFKKALADLNLRIMSDPLFEQLRLPAAIPEP